MGCFLGVGLAEVADTPSLTQAYGEFQQEALAHSRSYQPESVNTDGWSATGQAWHALFPGITVILCFLHQVLAIHKRLRRQKVLSLEVTKKLWNVYHSVTVGEFGQRLRRLHEWALKHSEDLPQSVLEKLVGLRAKAGQFKVAYQMPGAARTSNAVDRLMNYQDRMLYAMQYFHGNKTSLRSSIRAMAMLWNFHPYTRKACMNHPHARSPFEQLNGFSYHDNWLRNLLIASSLNARGTGCPRKHKLN